MGSVGDAFLQDLYDEADGDSDLYVQRLENEVKRLTCERPSEGNEMSEPETIQIKGGPSPYSVQIIGPDGKPMDDAVKATWEVRAGEWAQATVTFFGGEVDVTAEPTFVLDISEFDAGTIPMPAGLRYAEVRALSSAIKQAVSEAFSAGMTKGIEGRKQATAA